ncbi:MAG TPA: glycosyltransferase family 39 protein [Anaerolineae bacterium]|nr:glycosyltransferase family 39 protein [Anaerolineae bacterium]
MTSTHQPTAAPARDLTPWLLAAILLLSTLLRLGVALYLGNTLEETRGGTYDQISYDLLAQRVADGHGFSFAVDTWPYARANQPTAFWSYLYTLYLTLIYAIFGHQPLIARLIQGVIVGVLMPWLVWRIARRPFGSRVGLIAAGITAIYFYFIHYAASLMSEAFYLVGILWTVDVGMRLAEMLADPRTNQRRTLALGLEFGLAMSLTLLLRQVVIGFFTVLALWLLWIALHHHAVRRVLGVFVATAAVTGLLILPFVARNYQVFGRLTMPNTNAGFTFFWSNHPIYGTHFEAVLSPSHGISYQELIPPDLRDLNEAALDRALLLRGLQFVRDDPGRYLLLSLSRVPVYFQFWPTSDSTRLSNAARMLSFGLFLPFMLYGLILGASHLRRSGPLRPNLAVVDGTPDLRAAYVALFLLFILVYTAIHLASWANVRYRLPVDAFLILFAAYGIDDVLRRLARRRSGSWGDAQPQPSS